MQASQVDDLRNENMQLVEYVQKYEIQIQELERQISAQ